MTGQKQRIIRRFEREAKKKLEKLSYAYLDTMTFSLKEIKDIINYDDAKESKGVKEDG